MIVKNFKARCGSLGDFSQEMVGNGSKAAVNLVSFYIFIYISFTYINVYIYIYTYLAWFRMKQR